MGALALELSLANSIDTLLAFESDDLFWTSDIIDEACIQR